MSLYTKLYLITCVNVEYCVFAEEYANAFKEDEGDYARGGHVEDAARDQEKAHTNAQRKG